MSDNQRRMWCRILFLIMCVLPTTISGYWICHPQTADGWSLAIQAELGIETEIGWIETPGPFETVLRDVRFRDGDRTLLSTIEVRIEFGERNRIVIPHKLNDADSQGLAYLLNRINQHVLKSKRLNKIWRVDFESDTVVNRYTAQQIERLRPQVVPGADVFNQDYFWLQRNQVVLSGLQIDVAPSSIGGTATTAYFRIRDPSIAPGVLSQASDGTDPALSETMIFEIDAQKTGQVLKLNTREGRLPVWLLDGVEPRLAASLGERAKFEGKVEYVASQGRVEHLAGAFTDVDVTRYRLTQPGEPAWARIDVRECRFVDGQFTNWVALLTAPSISPTQIDQEDLLKPSLQFEPTRAIENAILRRRFAELPSNPKRP